MGRDGTAKTSKGFCASQNSLPPFLASLAIWRFVLSLAVRGQGQLDDLERVGRDDLVEQRFVRMMRVLEGDARPPRTIDERATAGGVPAARHIEFGFGGNRRVEIQRDGHQMGPTLIA